MTDAEALCAGDWLDYHLECDLPAGHDGDHHAEVEWPQSPPPPPFDPEANPGFAVYLAAKYGGQIDD